MKNYKIFKYIFILFTLQISLLSQQWFLVSPVNQPGLTPSISVSSMNQAWIVGGSGTPNVFKTDNGGYNWSVIQTAGISVELTCVAGFTGQYAFVGEGILSGNAKLLKTTNGGTNWVVVFETPNNRGFFNGLAFTKANGNLFGLAIAERIYRSSNAGLNWIELNSGVNGVSNAQNSLMIIDNNFYGFGMNNGAARIRMTTDNASSWLTQNINVAGNYTSAIAFHTNKLLGVAATSSSMPFISRTTDGGNTWTSINIGAGLTGNCYFNWIPEGPVIYALGENGGIKRSTDNGLNWVSMTTAGVTNLKHFDFIQFNNIVVGYAVSSNGNVIKTLDTLSVLTGTCQNENIVREFNLEQNYPNPFNPMTEIGYSISNESFVKLSIIDVLGKEVYTAVNENKKAGNYQVTIDGSGLGSGVYFYRLTAGDFTRTRKMILLK